MKKAFSLVELSVVLIILGLLIAGVVTGKKLVHQAELRKLVELADKYSVAANTFFSIYDALPGDITNASSYWSSCTTESGVPANTCDGDGDGVIEYSNHEDHRALQHMQLAEIVADGEYDGSLYYP